LSKKFLAFGVPNYSHKEIKAVKKVIRSRWLGMGKVTIDFENNLSNFLGSKHVLSVSSCTDALFLSLKTLDIGPDDEVIVPSFTWCSTVNSIIYTGATPVFCDVEKSSLNVDFSSILKKITNKTKAVLVVHFGGLAVEVKKLRSLLPKSISIVEDAAHAFGSKYEDGTYVGSSGNLTCFSFYANKNLSTGDGGAIAFQTDDKKEMIEKLRMNGMSKGAWSRYISKDNAFVNPIESLGYKMNYTDLQAAIGIIQLKRIDQLTKKRNRIAHEYIKELTKSKLSFELQNGINSKLHAKHLFTVIFGKIDSLEKRNHFVNNMRNKGIGVSVHYQPVHTQPYYRSYQEGERLSNTEYLGDRVVSLPISSAMRKSDVRTVVRKAKETLSGIT
jgi:perosamine synthetase